MSAAANEVRNKLEIVLSDLFLEISHNTTAFPTMVARPAIPYHVDKTIFAAMLNSSLSQQVLFIFAMSSIFFPSRAELAVNLFFWSLIWRWQVRTKQIQNISKSLQHVWVSVTWHFKSDTACQYGRPGKDGCFRSSSRWLFLRALNILSQGWNTYVLK